MSHGGFAFDFDDRLRPIQDDLGRVFEFAICRHDGDSDSERRGPALLEFDCDKGGLFGIGGGRGTLRCAYDFDGWERPSIDPLTPEPVELLTPGRFKVGP